ncbi:hypothetical protein Ahy_A03g010639 [Arachis hypogaea]|uniref:Protein-tyrosine-phosphatase MKP1 n=2 Tax=Arachis hypogaea TaxID=3818 RepID=A0A445DN08_ARAHY|nr:hypothetical protein Ahy_A03g010639 [Arachis hypogaea]
MIDQEKHSNMLGQDGTADRSAAPAAPRMPYSRSASWSDRSPATPRPPPSGNKPRSLLPPLQPLAIRRRGAEEWPSAGSDDLGVWPLPETPRGSVSVVGSSSEFQLKREKLAFYDKECSRIAEHVYLGSDTVAKNHELLRQNGITHVLNCVGFVCPEYFKRDFVYKTLWLQDSPTEDITSILYDVFDYFEEVREQGGRVLVHCCQGVSRSTSLVIAYLMWREGQSFEDAFQYVKNARGVTNPNMGFACQLLQCQKRVHATPASPNSILRMYRMAPHSPYDPLHLVPKIVNHPSAQALDSRGAFIVHVPSAIYVWTGNNCNSVMSSNARGAASQVVRYERATAPVLTIHEYDEPPEFWIALASADCDQQEKEDTSLEAVRPRKLDEYDLDYEIFQKALAGGVVPPFSVSNAGSETCLPARESGWGRLRRKLASGFIKGLFTSSKRNSTNEEAALVMEDFAVNVDPNDCSGREKGYVEVLDHFVPITDVDSSLPTSSDYLPCFTSSSSKSPTLSPSSSDYASSFTFSPSSTNLSSQQPSPSTSSMDSTETIYAKDASVLDSSSLFHKKGDVFLADQTSGGSTFFLPLKGSIPSIAERRGSNPPPRMLLPSSVTESPHPHRSKIHVRSKSFSLPELDDNLLKDVDCKQADPASCK